MANGANYSNVIAQASQKYGIPDSLLTAQINQESGFNPNAVSPAGAEGIAQFMPATAQSIGLKNPFDPTEAIPAMAKYDAQNFNQFGNITQMLEAYNEGPNAVANGVIAPGVKSYANNIINAANGTQPTTTTTKSVCVTLKGFTDCPNPLRVTQTDLVVVVKISMWVWEAGRFSPCSAMQRITAQKQTPITLCNSYWLITTTISRGKTKTS